MSQNPNAIHLLEKNKEMINWNNLSKITNAIHLLEKNKEKINEVKQEILTTNTNAINILEIQLFVFDEIHILVTNKDKIAWKALSLNPLIFE